MSQNLPEISARIRTIASHVTGARHTKLVAAANTLADGRTDGVVELMNIAATWDSRDESTFLDLAVELGSLVNVPIPELVDKELHDNISRDKYPDNGPANSAGPALDTTHSFNDGGAVK